MGPDPQQYLPDSDAGLAGINCLSIEIGMVTELNAVLVCCFPEVASPSIYQALDTRHAANCVGDRGRGAGKVSFLCSTESPTSPKRNRLPIPEVPQELAIVHGKDHCRAGSLQRLRQLVHQGDRELIRRFV